MMFNNHNDNDQFWICLKKVKILTTTILVGLSNYIFILIEKIY